MSAGLSGRLRTSVEVSFRPTTQRHVHQVPTCPGRGLMLSAYLVVRRMVQVADAARRDGAVHHPGESVLQ